VNHRIVVSGTQKTFARDRLITIFPKDNPGKVHAPADLARPGLKLDIANKLVPVGQYTVDMFDKMSKDSAYGADFKDRVLETVVSYENDVQAVVSKISRVQAGHDQDPRSVQSVGDLPDRTPCQSAAARSGPGVYRPGAGRRRSATVTTLWLYHHLGRQTDP